LMYSFCGMCRRLVTPSTRTATVATVVQNTMCHIVSAMGYRNPLYARMYLLNRITAMLMLIHTTTYKYDLAACCITDRGAAIARALRLCV